MSINHGYNILKKYTIDELLSFLEKHKTLPDDIIYNKYDLGDSIKRTHIIKELLLKDGRNCKGCNIKSDFFALGKDNADRWHLDLYATDSENNFHLFTIDHIHPKSKGGENNINNYQLLCKSCNEKKGNKVDNEEIVIKKEKNNYIEKRLMSLTQQILGFQKNIKSKRIVCINNQRGFTIGKQYKILDTKIIISNKNIKIEFETINDSNKKIYSKFDNFITKVEYNKKKK